jgi:hypothetical protein
MPYSETYEEYHAPGCNLSVMIHKWTFYYQDGSFETVIKRVRSVQNTGEQQ